MERHPKKNKVELHVQSVEMRGKTPSDTITFEATKLIDFSVCLNKKHKEQVRPRSRFLFIASIKIEMQLKNRAFEFSSEISVVPVVHQPYFRREPEILDALKRIKH